MHVTQHHSRRLSVLIRSAFILPALALALAMALGLPACAYAAHPLATEDTGVQGRGNWQLEANTDRTTERDPRFKNWAMNATVTYGLADTLDLAFNATWLSNRAGDASNEFHPGLGDASLFLKWRVHEEDKLSYVLKPILILPTGNFDKGLGGDRTRAGLVGVVTWSDEKLSLSANLGYTWNDNTVGERKDIWNTSAALMLAPAEKWHVAAEIGVYTNSDPATRKSPAFANLGLIYSPTDKLDFDIGYKHGLNDAEALYSIGAGVTMRW